MKALIFVFCTIAVLLAAEWTLNDARLTIAVLDRFASGQ